MIKFFAAASDSTEISIVAFVICFLGCPLGSQLGCLKVSLVWFFYAEEPAEVAPVKDTAAASGRCGSVDLTQSGV